MHTSALNFTTLQHVSLQKIHLTVCNLQQGFGDHTAGDVEGLTAVISSIWTLDCRDGEISCLRHRESAGRRRRLRREQEVLETRNKTKIQNHTNFTTNIQCTEINFMSRLARLHELLAACVWMSECVMSDIDQSNITEGVLEVWTVTGPIRRV